jgi:acyl CoA:acetate/3-ketoacid CoA transferase alpha subunit
MVSMALQDALERLGKLRDAASGLPILSHRAGIGALVVSGKKLMRSMTQPMINEVLRKQSRFNEEALLVLRTLVLDLKSLQDGLLAAQGDVEERLRRLEKNVERLAGASAKNAATSTHE